MRIGVCKTLAIMLGILVALSAFAPASAQWLSPDVVPYQTPDQVWDDLTRGMLDSSEAMNILALFDRPIRWAPGADLDRLLALPGIQPADIALLRLLLESGNSPDDHNKCELIEPFLERDYLRGRINAALSPSLSLQNDFRKRVRVQTSAGPLQLNCELSDDTAGTFCARRSLHVGTEHFQMDVGEFSFPIGKGLLLGRAASHPLRGRRQPGDLGRSLITPLSSEPDGIAGQVVVHHLRAGLYGLRLYGCNRNPLVAGSWLQYHFSRHTFLGAQLQLTELGPVGGCHFALSRIGLSGEAAVSGQSGPAWIAALARADHGSELTLYRYPHNSFLLLGNPLHRRTGQFIALEDETLHVSVAPEQGLQIDQTFGRSSFRLRFWQIPENPATGFQARGSSLWTLGEHLHFSGLLLAEQNLEGDISLGPQASIVSRFRVFDVEAGGRARTNLNQVTNSTEWIGAIVRPGAFHRFRSRIYLNQSITEKNSERIWVSYETGASRRARVQTSWNVPLDDPAQGWASVRLEMLY